MDMQYNQRMISRIKLMQPFTHKVYDLFSNTFQRWCIHVYQPWLYV